MNSRIQTDIVRALFSSRGYTVKAEVNLGKGLWKGIRADFFVSGITAYPKGLAVECKWQDSTGSTDEKVAYTVLNIKRCYPVPCLLLCSGPEIERAMMWAKTEVGGALIAVLNTDEFIKWIGALEEL